MREQMADNPVSKTVKKNKEEALAEIDEKIAENRSAIEAVLGENDFYESDIEKFFDDLNGLIDLRIERSKIAE